MDPPANPSPEMATLQQIEEAGRTRSKSASASRPVWTPSDINLATIQERHPADASSSPRGEQGTEDEAATLLGGNRGKKQPGLSVLFFFKLVSLGAKCGGGGEGDLRLSELFGSLFCACVYAD